MLDKIIKMYVKRKNINRNLTALKGKESMIIFL